MPREARPPRAKLRATMLSPQKAPILMPLNDDREEKAVRFQSRQALHEIQMNHIRAAASPIRKRRSLGTASSPQAQGGEDQENDDSQSLNVVSGTAVTPMKRVPILANFEEWMKMATDNKINAANSWNFALIDYFHDMSLLKEGDGVNFQKASCTLDGCVKIYTSRVDSVATETGKLLSGLADSGNKKSQAEENDGEVGEGDDEEGEEGNKKRAKRKTQRSSEATLASSFAQLQLKKMELEFAVDPLFKKASADFDEGGAKGLLLNHLTVDVHGRIVFDSSDDQGISSGQDQESVEVGAVEAEDSERTTIAQDPEARAEETPQPTVDIDIAALATRFFPNMAQLDEQDICPSLKTFELGGDDDALALPFLKAPDDWRKDQKSTPTDNDNQTAYGDDAPPAFDDYDDDAIGGGGFDVIGEVGFGEGGEAWAREAAIDTRARPTDLAVQDGADTDAEAGIGEVGDFEANSAHYGVSLSKDKDLDRENILSYFDQTLQKNWAGPEHWRIRKIKDSVKPTAPKRKEKEPFEIDFLAPLTQAMADMIYTPAASNSAISLPKSQWKSKTRNLLPDDKHFNSRQLIHLFLKPKARIGARRTGHASSQQQRAHNSTNNTPTDNIDLVNDAEMDQAFWARQQAAAAAGLADEQDRDQGPAQGNYDADFFQDDNLGLPSGDPDDDDDNFADAQEGFAKPAMDTQDPVLDTQGTDLPMTGMGIDGTQTSSQGAEGFGTQLVTQSRRLRPEYVQYARVAKKVDVRRLKEEMWRGLALPETAPPPPLPLSTPDQSQEQEPAILDAKMEEDFKDAKDAPLRFTAVMRNLQGVYPAAAMADISTSFCFICLLHLANEKGLELKSEGGGDEGDWDT